MTPQGLHDLPRVLIPSYSQTTNLTQSPEKDIGITVGSLERKRPMGQSHDSLLTRKKQWNFHGATGFEVRWMRKWIRGRGLQELPRGLEQGITM